MQTSGSLKWQDPGQTQPFKKVNGPMVKCSQITRSNIPSG